MRNVVRASPAHWLSLRRITYAFGMALLLSLLSGALFADTRTWGGGGANANASTAANWKEGVAPIEGDAIVLDTTTNKNMTWDLNLAVASWTQSGYTGTVTIATVYPGQGAFTNFTILGDCIISNGVWTQVANPNVNYESKRLCATIGGNLIVGSDAMVNVTGKGYTTGKGPGASSLTVMGGSYGGHGKGWNFGGPCYGSVVAPTNLGSGGGYSSGSGAIQLMVVGEIRNDGLICADGAASGYSSGSGGSIWLTSGTLVGIGTIRANGGLHGGGGGRIALVVSNSGANFSNFTGTISAYHGGGQYSGCAGTIYLEKHGDVPAKGELIVNNYSGGVGYSTLNTDLSGIEAVTYEFSRITLTNAAILSVGSNDTLIVTNTVLITEANLSNGIWIAGGTLLAPPEFVCSNIFIGISATGSTFSPAASLTVGTNAEFRVDKPHSMTCNVIIEDGGKLTHTANSSTEAYKMNLTINGSLTVGSGGGVDVTDKGFAAKYGPGADYFNNCGGSHGGLGAGGLCCYGSITAPTNLGSGGTTVAGGGAIQLSVSGEVRNEGGIRANSRQATATTGSGGSVYIIAGILSGAGPIQANSATNVTGNNPGGGGRIALVVTNAGENLSTYAGLITAYGGRKTTVSGGAGTVYLQSADKGLNEGVLIVDNDNLTGLATEISSNVTDAVVGDVILRNKGFLRMATNQTLMLSGIWSNGASFDAQLDSRIIFAGNALSTSTVYGTNIFMGLICTNAGGKTMLFEAGMTNTVSAQGRLILKGFAASTNLFLRSTVDGDAWYLTLDPLAAQAVSCVDVKDSDALAGGGAEVIAINSKDRGANPNWNFLTIHPGMEITWTGASSSLFSLRSNWDLDRSPLETDVIVIPAGCDNDPVLDADRIVHALNIQNGATLALNGWDLVVTNMLTVAGTLTVSGTETVTLLKDADFTGGVFDAVRSTLVLGGGDAQALNLGGATFFKILVENSGAPLTFSGGFTATELRCEAPDGTRTLIFEPGKTVKVRDLVLQGSITSTNIVLHSASPGQAWNLAVSGYRSVRGADVQDSDASSGLPVPAILSKDSGNNLNWFFDAAWSEWLGTINNNFHTAGNWASGIVPDSTSRVRVESANPMVITGAVVILDLTVGGGADAALVTANAPITVIEDIVLMTNGTLVLNRPSVVSNGLYVLAGGMLTHSANASTEVNKLDVTVWGAIGVDLNGAVDVTAKGYDTSKGPGGNSSGGYGGRGSTQVGPGLCYGSITAPTNLGSGGSSTRGGGAILLKVRGAMLNDGLLSADGGASGNYYTGSGGSVNIVAGELTGNGIIRANAGVAPTSCGGGGGRVALAVTNTGASFSGYTGLVEARSGKFGTSASGGGAGTIYMKNAADRIGYGTVLVDNNGLTSSGSTDVPPSPPNVTNEVEFVSFNVANAATLRLTNDFMLGDIFLQSTDSRLNLGFKTLTVRSREHPLGLGYVTNYGAIIWWPDIPKGAVFSTW